MKYQSLSVAVSIAVALVLGQPASSLAEPKILKVPAVAPEPPPVEITAKYAVTLNGFDLGSLDFSARIVAGAYTADSDVRLSALLGAFRWHGVTRVSGTVTGKEHRPQGYSFEFDGSGSSGSIRMGFTGNEITTLAVDPVTRPAQDSVPLERKHLKGALDPLSTILSMTRVDADTPCGRKFELFDGKQRFDLALLPRRVEPIALANGARDTLVVCRVKYTPVAGFRPTAETTALAANNGIEIAFRRVAAAGLMVPHRVVIPTIAGDAVIEASRLSIANPAGPAIAHAE